STTVPSPDYGSRLEFSYTKGGISPVTPPRPRPGFRSLPPILRNEHNNPIVEYSKGPQGLSVLPRVSGIFTTATVSPSLSWRQYPCYYAIHAGRNLPDKEFRYLRTVIV